MKLTYQGLLDVLEVLRSQQKTTASMIEIMGYQMIQMSKYLNWQNEQILRGRVEIRKLNAPSYRINQLEDSFTGLTTWEANKWVCL